MGSTLLHVTIWAFLLVVMSGVATAPSVCPSGWTLVNGRCFLYRPNGKIWQDAQTDCNGLDTTDQTLRVADPRNLVENVYVNSLCKTNSAVWPSPWHVWDSRVYPPTPDYAFTSASPGPSPTPAQAASDYTWLRYLYTDSSYSPVPKFSCTCLPPSNPSATNWCMNVPTSMTIVRVGMSWPITTLTQCTVPTGTTCPTPPTGYNSILCQPPSVLPSSNGTVGVGVGTCWLGGSRSSLDSSGLVIWNTANPEASTTVSTNYFEPILRINTLPTTSQPQYIRLKSMAYSNVAATPNCLAMWNWRQNGTWIVDWCTNFYPYVCVRDAKCSPGYSKASRYTVTSTGAITQGVCVICAGGTYRSSTDDERVCISCPTGYYGNTTVSAKSQSTCSGFCPAGTYCPLGTATPIPCPVGTYGLALLQPTGPGWDTQANGCAPCLAGKYCDVTGLTLTALATKPCNAGRCSTSGATDATCTIACPAGYYCPTGSACPGNMCGDGAIAGNPVGAAAYCPYGSSQPSTVPPGYYGSGTNATLQNTYYECPPGFSCANGVRTPCPLGFYSNTEILVAQRITCQPCQSGYFCPGPSSPTTASSTSPTQQFCANDTDPYPATNYCINGVRFTINPTNDTVMTIPADAPLNQRQGIVLCPTNKICYQGLAYDRVTWNNCPNGATSVTVPELLATAATSVTVNASLFATLNVSDWVFTYSLLNQTFWSPTLLQSSTSPSCRSGITSNDGIFAVNSATGNLMVNRYAPNPRNGSAATQFEVCAPITDVRYNLTLQATISQRSKPFVASISCAVSVVIADQNDQPVFANTVYNRYIQESAAENTQAARCSGVLSTVGCPDDSTPNADNSIVATDEDFFGQGNLNYFFVGNLSTNQAKLKVNSCTGLISQVGGVALRYSDPTIPWYNGTFKRLNYTLRAMDDGNSGAFTPLYMDTLVIVYIQNVNDAPVITTPPTTDFWIPESTSSHRFPAPSLLTPNTLQYTDDDPFDTHVMSILRNDALAFQILNSSIIATTATGESVIDYESSKKVYSIDVEVRDNGVPSLAAAMTLSIRVANMNDPPVIESSLVFYVVENANIGDPICRDLSGQCIVPNPAHAVKSTDPDQISTDITTYSLTNNANGIFAINSTSGQITVARANAMVFENASLNVATGTGRAYTLTVVASSNGVGVVTQPGLPTYVETDTRTFTVYLVHVNKAPYFVTPNTVPFRVVETWPVGTALTYVNIHAADPDNTNILLFGQLPAQQQLTFSVSPISSNATTDGANFFTVATDNVDNSLAKIVVRSQLDYESAPVCSSGFRCYTLNIRVTDPGNLYVDQVYEIDLVNVVEVPVFTQGSYTSTIAETVNSAGYAAVSDIIPSVPLMATNVDIGGNNYLSYSLIAGDGLDKFYLTNLAPGSGFKLSKYANTMIDYEVKSAYTFKVRATYTIPGSSAIGKACTYDQGVSIGCGTAAFCQNSQCYETCPTYSNVTTTILSTQVPRVDVFFCQNLTGVNHLSLSSPLYYETVDALVGIQLVDLNDNPYILDHSDTNPSPDFISGANCSLAGVLSLGIIQNGDQFPFSAIPVFDEDLPNPGPRAAPFAFVATGGSFWSTFQLVNNATGQIKFPKCTSNCSFVAGQIFNGTIQVLDQALGTSTCKLQVTMLNQNTPPYLGADFTVAAVPENLGAGTIVFVGYNSTQLAVIDQDVTRAVNPDKLTFSTTYSLYFSVDNATGAVTLNQPLSYEAAYPTFTQTLLIRVVDTFGANSAVQITVPIINVNKPPTWSVGQLTFNVYENTPGLTVVSNVSSLASDPDIYAVNPLFHSINFSLPNGTGCPFEITSVGIVRVKAGALLDFETLPNSWVVYLRVMDGLGLYSDIQTTISLLNVAEPPILTGTASMNVSEGNGGAIGLDLLDMSLFFRDQDNLPTSTLTFTINSGNVGGVFSISSAAKLQVSPGAVLDYEGTRYYLLSVTATSQSALSTSGNFSVYVNNVNDVSVTAISVVAGPNFGSQQLACDGSISRVRITGANLGLTTNSPPATITARYRRTVSVGPAANNFTSAPCVVTIPNIQVECNVTLGGSGNNLIWDVTVSVPGTQIISDTLYSIPSTIAFPTPVITAVSGSSLMSTAGGQTITVIGTCLGTPNDLLTWGNVGTDTYLQMCTTFDGTCRPMTVGCAATSASGNAVTCTSATLSGLGQFVSWTVRSGRQTSQPLVAGGYAVPTLSALSGYILKTSGTITAPGIRFNGTNFGGLGTAPTRANFYYNNSGTTVTYSFTGCTVTIAYTQVTCTGNNPGVGSNMWIQLEFGLQYNPTSPLISFESPTVATVATDGNVLSPTPGGIFVTLTGTSFGPVCGVPGTSVAAGAANCALVLASYTRGSLNVFGVPIVYVPNFCAVISQTQIVCTTVEGTGRNLVWSVTVGGQQAFVSPTAGTTGYSSPVVGAYAGPGAFGALTSGYQYLDLSGAHFGPVGGAVVTAVYGDILHPTEFTAVNCTVTTAHTVMRCFTGVGAGNALSWQVTVDGQISRAQLSDYGPPSISTILLGTNPANNLVDDGGQVVTLNGINFGPPGSTRYLESVTYGPANFQGLYTVTSGCTVVSHEQLQCTMIPGLGSNLQWRVTVRGQVSNSPGALTSFSLPSLTLMSQNTSKTNGGDVIYIQGSYFGFCDPNVQVRVLFGSILVNLKSVYRPSSVDPINLAAECHPGLPLSYGPTRQLYYIIPEMTASNVIKVQVQIDSVVFPGGTYITPQFFTLTYGLPYVSDVYAEPGPAVGTIQVTLSGGNFCASESCCQTYLGSSVWSANVNTHTHDSITFVTDGPGSTFVRCPGGDTPVQVFNTQNPFVYGVVRVSDFARIDGVTFGTPGGELIYIFSLFATSTTTVSVGGQDATVTAVDSFSCDSTDVGFRPETISGVLNILVPNQVCTRITAAVPPGQGTQNDVVVTVGALKSRANDPRFELLAYTAPIITGLSGFNRQYSTQGDLSILTVFGTNFGLSGKVLFGPSSFAGTRNEIACGPGSPNLNWTHTMIQCSVPPGEGSSLSVRVSTGGQTSPASTSGSLQYIPPTITSFYVMNTTDNLADTIGGQTLVIVGINFGRFYDASAIATSPGELPTVYLGSSLNCVILTSVHTQVTCTIPPAEGKNLAVRLLVAGQAPGATAPSLFSYGVPVIYYFTPTLGNTNGLDDYGNRQVFQIIGKNFGVDQLTVQFGTGAGPVTLGIRSARDNRDDFLYPGTNHTSISVYLPALFGARLNVTVTVAGQVSDPNGPKFSYAPPQIFGANVTVLPGRGLASQQIQVDNMAWTRNQQFGQCRALRPSNGSASVEIQLAFKTTIEIAAGGAYTRHYRFFPVANYTTITDTTCAEGNGNLLGEAIQTGTFVDLGPHPTYTCMRAYQDIVATATGYPIDSQLFPQGGFGFYIVSELTDLYLSYPSYDTLADAMASPQQTHFALDDDPTASLVTAIPQAPNQVPTSGCNYENWEDYNTYLSEVQKSFGVSGTAVTPRNCNDKAKISVPGKNFGSGTNAQTGSLRAFLIDDRGVIYEGSTTSSPGNHQLPCLSAEGCIHQDDLIVFQAPFGSGRGLRIMIQLDNQNDTSEPLVDYVLPSVSNLLPGTPFFNQAPLMTMSGTETVTIMGTNLGYSTSDLSVLFNGKPCTNTTWVSGFTQKDGLAQIQCIPSADVPGVKSMFICVGGQGTLIKPADPQKDQAAIQYGNQFGAWNTTGNINKTFATTITDLAVARCPNTFFGRIGEKCLPCPSGGNCYPGFSDPVPQGTFSLITMPVASARAQEGACNPARLDRSQLTEFPDMVFYDTCTQIVRCVPPEACADQGVCTAGYEYQLYRCRDKRGTNGTDNSCRTYFDAATNTWQGVDADCQLNTPPNQACSYDNPQDCSVCKVQFSAPDSDSVSGVCTCVQPQRCALCTATTHYRLNNECVKCPDNPALIFSLFILAGVACIALAYYLQKRKINLAFISVGVDYFQVLAVLSTTNVPWPPFIRAIFTIFTLFLASIDIAAPECLVPNLEFSTKFYLTELLPVLALGILLSIHIGYTFYKVFKLGKHAKWLSHVSRLIGIYVLIVYVLYLSLTKKSLDVFNCNPLDPDDGYSYTAFSSLQCDGGGLCRCYEPGGVQESLIPPAIVFLGIYTFGFPAWVSFIIFTHRYEIREDQYLRANRLGDRRETNPRAYMTRKRYQLMYMHFKPRYSFWMLAILGRKFGVAFASLMFRGNPSFQLAVILVVLFTSFTLQVSIRPYMSPGEYPVVIKELNDNSKKADEEPEEYAVYRDLFRKVTESMRIQAELIRKEKMVRHRMGAGFWEESRQAAREHDKRSVAEKYFFDLNAVEAVLLGATIIISLSGIMFESGQFVSNRADIQWQGNLVVILVFIVLFGSLGYYALVFINELWPITFARWCGRCFLRYQNDGVTNEELDKMKDNDIVLDANPLFAATGPVGDKSKSLQKEIEASKDALALAKRQNEELKRLRSELESGSGVTARNPLAMLELQSVGETSRGPGS